MDKSRGGFEVQSNIKFGIVLSSMISLVIPILFLACISDSGKNNSLGSGDGGQSASPSSPNPSIQLYLTGAGLVPYPEDHIQMSGACDPKDAKNARVGFQLFSCSSNGGACDTNVNAPGSGGFYCENKSFYIIVPRVSVCENIECRVQAILYNPKDSTKELARSDKVIVKFTR